MFFRSCRCPVVRSRRDLMPCLCTITTRYKSSTWNGRNLSWSGMWKSVPSCVKPDHFWCSFCWNFTKWCGAPSFWKNVLDRFFAPTLKLPIQTLLSVVPTHSSFLVCHTTQFQQNEHSPEVQALILSRCHQCSCFYYHIILGSHGSLFMWAEPIVIKMSGQPSFDWQTVS